MLLKDDHPALQQALEERQECCSRTSDTSAKMDASTAKKHMVVYKESHSRWCAESCRPATLASRRSKTMCMREFEVLCYWQKLASKKYDECKGLMVADVGQSIEWVRSGSVSAEDSVLPTILPNSKIWLLFVEKHKPSRMRQERFLIGSEALRLQGLDPAKFPKLQEKYKESFMMNLAGNMFSVAVVLTMWSAVVLGKWKQPREDHAEETNGSDVSSALSFLECFVEEIGCVEGSWQELMQSVQTLLGPWSASLEP